MNILYGVAGVGYGHASRALLVAKHLEKAGHKVKVITYGDGLKVLKDEFDCLEVNGLDLVFEEGKVKKGATISKNVKFVAKDILKIKKLRRMRKDFKPDLCISDMEPIVPIMSFLHNFPLVSLDNQHALTNLKMKVPWRYKKDAFIARRIIKRILGRADAFIVTSFSNAKIKWKKTVVVPPIVREEIQKLKPKYGKKILVYLSKSEKDSLNVLKDLDEEFVVYGFDVKKKKGNLEFRKRDTFLRDLRDCKAVIGTAGFSLMGEAVYLNKPYLAIPLEGQFEQVSNALLLEDAGFGMFSKSLNEKDVIYFLYKLDKYKEKLAKYNPSQDKVYKTVDKVIKALTR